MHIIVGKYSGCCLGVKRAISRAEEALSKTNNTIYCLGELAHNPSVMNSLKRKGLKVIDSIDEAQDNVIIRAHGTSKNIYDTAKNMNLQVIDLTCPKVLQVHKHAEFYAKKNYFIFLLGIHNHPETMGNFSFCGSNSYIIETIDDINNALISLHSSNIKQVLIIAQTTFNLYLFDEITKIITNSLDETYNVHIEKSICNATDLRQTETKQISSEVELMIVIGGKNSHNTKQLYKIASNNCSHVLYIQTKDDLDLNFIKNFKSIGIVAGASTPQYIINDVYNICSNI